MQNHLDLSDLEFEQQFASCALDPSLFNHEAHLRLAWIHIRKYGFEKAVANIETQLKNYVAHLDAADKYHQTLTIVAINAVHHFTQKTETDSFQTFIQAFPELKTDFKALINSHYSYDIFNHAEARKTYLKPDLIPFKN